MLILGSCKAHTRTLTQRVETLEARRDTLASVAATWHQLFVSDSLWIIRQTDTTRVVRRVAVDSRAVDSFAFASTETVAARRDSVVVRQVAQPLSAVSNKKGLGWLWPLIGMAVIIFFMIFLSQTPFVKKCLYICRVIITSIFNNNH